MKQFARLVCNLLPTGCRVDNLEGKEYTVVPMVILTEGVHKGSQGPLYYPKEELSKTPVVWNHKPIVVYHPTMNGEGVSACDPVVLNSRKVGLMMNTKFEGGRLKSEAWLEKERANTVDERIMTAVEAKEMMELSTGVFIDVEETTGTWKGEEYAGIARNYRPDHLALLPDMVGACSIADGAGLLRNQAADAKGKDMIQKGKDMVAKGEEDEDEDMIAKGKAMIKKGKSMLASMQEPIQKAVENVLMRMGLTDNEMSYSNISQSLSTVLREKYGIKEGSGSYVWVCDVYSNFVIYEYEGKLYRLGYMSNDSGVSLSDETPVEVRRVTEYRTVEDGAYVGNQNQQQNMNKKELVDAIITTANSEWKEADRPALMALNEGQLKLIQNSLPKAAAAGSAAPPAAAPQQTATSPSPSAAPSTAAPASAAPATNAPPDNKVISVEEFIKQAPKGIQDVLTNSMAVLADEKKKLVDAILANANNPFAKEDLEARPLGELKNLARLSGTGTTQTTPNYSGQAPTPTGNSQVEEALEVPTLNFASK